MQENEGRAVCEHPLRFWVVYRTLVFGSWRRGFFYRCPVCRETVPIHVTSPILTQSLITAFLYVTVRMGLDALLSRHGVGWIAEILLVFSGMILVYLALCPLVCYIKLRRGHFKLYNPDELPL